METDGFKEGLLSVASEFASFSARKSSSDQVPIRWRRLCHIYITLYLVAMDSGAEVRLSFHGVRQQHNYKYFSLTLLSERQ